MRGRLAETSDANPGLSPPWSNFQPKKIYLDLKLVALSTTYTTKLPPVRARLHAPEGDAVAALRQTADRKTGGEAHVQQEGHVGTAPATPADLFRADHTLSPERP